MIMIVLNGVLMVLIAIMAGALASYRRRSKRHLRNVGYALTGAWLTVAGVGTVLLLTNGSSMTRDLIAWGGAIVVAFFAHVVSLKIRQSYSPYDPPFLG